MTKKHLEQNMLASGKTNYALALRFLLLIVASASMMACSSTKRAHDPEQLYVGETPVYDPFEGTNRMVFSFNTAIDSVLIHPIVETYRFIVPRPARKGFSNFLKNLSSPVQFANQVLQGDIEGATNVVTRAAINSTIGIGGLIDVAEDMGIERESEDFGQTLAVWGVGNGPYLVVPFLGPSTLRDYVGYFVDSYADPLNIYLFNIDEDEWVYARTGANYLDLRDSLMDVLKDMERSSVDYYAATRSIYYQRRNALINDSNRQTETPVDTYSDYDYPEFDDF